MGVICVIQARTGSTRFPRKVLAELDGEPMLAFMVRRLRGLDLPLLIATSREPGDDAVEELGCDLGVPVVRGPEDDVLARYVLAVSSRDPSAVVRLTGDCPLIAPEVVTMAVEEFSAGEADYVSNTLLRTYPDGLDVEVLGVEALLAADHEATDPDEREHVTPFLYRRPERFGLGAMRHDRYLAHVRLTVDHPQDLERVRQVVGDLGGADFTLEDLLAEVADEPLPEGTLVRIAMPGDPAVPNGVDLRDPSRPVYSLLDEHADPVGWAQVVVRGGIGELDMEIGPGESVGRAAYLGALREALGLQVVDLEGP